MCWALGSVGTWWETPARREFVSFAASVFPATFMLSVKSSIASGGIETVFYPFTGDLWVSALPSLCPHRRVVICRTMLQLLLDFLCRA